MGIEVKKLEKYIDIYDIFRVLMSQDNFKENKISFLDSSLKNKYGKYSIIGINPYLELKEKDNKFYINDKLSDENFEEYLDRFLKENKQENKYNLPLISGGIAYFSYDYGRKFENIKTRHKKDVDIPEAIIRFYKTYIIEDIEKQEIYISYQDKKDYDNLINILKNTKIEEENLIKIIKNRIQQKDELFNETKDITLIGNSLFDNWKIEKLNNNLVVNLGIAGISTKQYQEYILDINKIKYLANKVFIMTGTNDIVGESLSFETIFNNINKLIKSLLKINKDSKIYFIEIPSIAFRMDRNKEEIFRLNEYLKNNLDKIIKYIEINKYMTDDFGNLKLEYTYDGLHFNEEGYKILEKILEKEIQ